jgi:hypothetical protein
MPSEDAYDVSYWCFISIFMSWINIGCIDIQIGYDKNGYFEFQNIYYYVLRNFKSNFYTYFNILVIILT